MTVVSFSASLSKKAKKRISPNVFNHLQLLLFVALSLTYRDSGTWGFLYQQRGQWRGVNRLFQVLRGLALSQRPHWSVRGNTHITHCSPLPLCKEKYNNTVEEIHTPTFHLWSESLSLTEEELYGQIDGHRHIFSLSVVSLRTAAEFKLFATWKAWKRRYETRKGRLISGWGRL